MSDHLEQLYQEVILDHNKNPRNFKALSSANSYSHGHNPLCGDDFHLYLELDEKNQIKDVGFQGSGCAISTSSASIMTTMVKNRSVREAQELARSFHQLVTDDDVSEATRQKTGRLKIFEGVKKYPVRVKCAMLIWRALEDAVTKKGNIQTKQNRSITTEGEES